MKETFFNGTISKSVAEQQLRPQTNLLYEAEKDLVLLILKYGLYEITTGINEEDNIPIKQRIDQYVVNDLYNDGIVLQNPVLRKVYNHYGEIGKTPQRPSTPTMPTATKPKPHTIIGIIRGFRNQSSAAPSMKTTTA